MPWNTPSKNGFAVEFKSVAFHAEGSPKPFFVILCSKACIKFSNALNTFTFLPVSLIFTSPKFKPGCAFKSSWNVVVDSLFVGSNGLGISISSGVIVTPFGSSIGPPL